MSGDINIKGQAFRASVYVVPTLSPRGWVTWWPQRKQGWARGFVARFFWLGFVWRSQPTNKTHPDYMVAHSVDGWWK